MGKLVDLTGKRFGFWLVKYIGPKNKNGKTQWLCKCECGSEKLVTSNSLRSCNSTSCGCNHNPNLLNKLFGKLTVIEKMVSKTDSRVHWLCKCNCGNFIVATTNQLRNTIIVSCKNCHDTVNKKSFLDIFTEINNLLWQLKDLQK